MYFIINVFIFIRQESDFKSPIKIKFFDTKKILCMEITHLCVYDFHFFYFCLYGTSVICFLLAIWLYDMIVNFI